MLLILLHDLLSCRNVFVNLGNKSGLNPGAPAFTSTPGSYSNAVKGEPNKDKGILF